MESDRPATPDGGEREPRGTQLMAKFRWLLIVLAASAAVYSWWSIAGAEASSRSAPRYYCPMHPEITSHDPGECPICHMTLEPIPEQRKKAAQEPAVKAPSAPASAVPAADVVYTCPMHPEVKSKEPGRCPICKMDLVAQAPAPASTADLPAGTSEVTLTLDRVQAIGVRTAEVQAAGSAGALRAPAVIEAPESGFAAVHARAPGFVERVSVRETGVKVRAGQELAALYSPEIYQAGTELITVSRWGDDPDARGTTERLEQKLALLGVGKAAVKRMLERGAPERTISLSAPISGFVSKRNVVLGSYVTSDTPLFEIVDLSKVYVVANLYPNELQAVKLGSAATFTPAAAKGRSFPAKVDLVYPAVDPSARTKRVRLVIPNPETLLAPGEYGNVVFDAKATPRVTVPRDAVVDTGRQVYVFVALGEGRFSPRLVELGAELGTDRVEVRHGLEPGLRVVSGATFLIDSESRLRASISESAP